MELYSHPMIETPDPTGLIGTRFKIHQSPMNYQYGDHVTHRVEWCGWIIDVDSVVDGVDGMVDKKGWWIGFPTYTVQVREVKFVGEIHERT